MSYYELTLTVAPPFRDPVIQQLIDSGCLGFIERDEDVLAYFPETADIATITRELSIIETLLEKSGHTDALTFSHQVIPEQDWNEVWKKEFKPIDIGERFTVLPPWEASREGRINLIIDPAMAFGTGHHETTRSCLVLMEKYSDTREKNSFLDLGTGTGILAIAASKLGYRRVVAVDTDPLAVDAGRKNASINQEPQIDLREGGLPDLDDTFNVIAANLISGLLTQIASTLSEHLKPGGIVILAGILTGQEEEVIDSMNRAGLKLTEQYADGKWISLVMEHATGQAPRRGSGRVLIMDDEEMILEVAGNILNELGYSVSCARDGAEAIAEYEAAMTADWPFDAVIMDLTIPGGMGGQEAMARLRGINPDVKAIVTSGDSQDPVMEQFRDFGFRGAITKPYSIKALSEIISRIISE